MNTFYIVSHVKSDISCLLTCVYVIFVCFIDTADIHAEYEFTAEEDASQ